MIKQTAEYEMDAYLGDFKDHFIAKQGQDGYAALLRVAGRIQDRYPDEDDTDAREAALTAAAQVGFGDAYLSGLADAMVVARKAERAAMAALTGAMIWKHEGGMSKSDLARSTGVTRTTVDRAVRS